jgi:hypothetical protein
LAPAVALPLSAVRLLAVAVQPPAAQSRARRLSSSAALRLPAPAPLRRACEEVLKPAEPR